MYPITANEKTHITVEARSRLGELVLTKLRGTTWAAGNTALRSAIATFFEAIETIAAGQLDARVSMRSMSELLRTYFAWVVEHRVVDLALKMIGGSATRETVMLLQREKRIYVQELANAEAGLRNLGEVLEKSGKTERELLAAWLTPNQLERYTAGTLRVRDVLSETPEIFFVEHSVQ